MNVSTTVHRLVKRVLSWRARLRSGDRHSETSRSDQRYYRILLTASSAAGSRVVSVGVQLALVPLMLSYLGEYRYGLWLTLQSMIAFSTFADLGIGNGAMNAISAAHAKKDSEQVSRIVASALAMLTALAACGLVLIVLALRFVTANHLAKDGNPMIASDTTSAIAVFSVYFALTLPLGFIERVNSAFQEGAITNISRSGVSVLALLATTAAAATNGSFTLVCIATLAPQLLGWGIVWTVEFYRRPMLAPQFSKIDLTLARGLLRVGALFLGVQIMSTLNWSMDNLLISALLGPESVPLYGVPARIFSLVGTVSTLILTPLWPAYADAVAHGDMAWVRSTLKRSLMAAFVIATPLSLAAAVMLPYILQAWTGGRITTTPMLSIGLAMLTVCQTLCAALAMYWNGTSAIRVQFIMGMALVIVSLPAKVVVLHRYGLSPMGMVSAGLIVGVVLVPAYFLVRSTLTGRGSVHIGEVREYSESK